MSSPGRSPLAISGLILWRGGLAFSLGAWLYYGAWQYIKMLNWPGAIKVGAALAAAGAGLLLLSMILERRGDVQSEGSLTDD